MYRFTYTRAVLTCTRAVLTRNLTTATLSLRFVKVLEIWLVIRHGERNFHAQIHGVCQYDLQNRSVSPLVYIIIAKER